MVLLEDPQTRGFAQVDLAAGIDKRILYLEETDQKLLQLTIHGRLTRREAGLLVGMSSGTVTRRIRRILARLHDPLVAALVDGGKLLPELHQEVGLAYFLRNWSIARITVEFSLSEHEVKRMLQYVRGWHDAMKGK